MQNLFFSSSSNSKNPIFGQENVFLTQCVCFEGNMIIRDSIFYATFIVSSEFSTVHTCKYIGWVRWSLALACCQGRFWNISRLKDFLVALFKICWGVKKETAILLWMDRVMQYILRKWTLCLIKLDPFKKKISVLGVCWKFNFELTWWKWHYGKLTKIGSEF